MHTWRICRRNGLTAKSLLACPHALLHSCLPMWRALQANPSDLTVEEDNSVLDETIDTETSVRWQASPASCAGSSSRAAAFPSAAARVETRLGHSAYDPSHFVVARLPSGELEDVGGVSPSTVTWSPAAVTLLSGSINAARSTTKDPCPPAKPLQLSDTASEEVGDDDRNEEQSDEEAADDACSSSKSTALQEKKRRRTNLMWTLKLARSEHSVFQAAFEQLAIEHHGSTWVPRSGYLIRRRGPRQGARVQRYNCAFAKHAGCPFLIRTVEFEDNTWEIDVADHEHSDHTQSLCLRGLPKHIKLALAAPLHEKPPKELQILAAENHQLVLTPALRGKILSFQKRERRRGDGVNLPSGQRQTYGGLETLLAFTPRETLTANPEFTSNTAWLLSPAEIDAENHRIVAVFSTDNLLLNGYRKGADGMPGFVAIDCTYRLTAEGPGCMVLGTLSADQKWHSIAYGLVSREDERAHTYVLASVKSAIETVVAERAAAGLAV